MIILMGKLGEVGENIVEEFKVKEIFDFPAWSSNN